VGSVSEIDLNLLSTLGALLEERNLTRAGARLRLSQPTMSGALARLRRHFDDDLLVRSGREYALTPVAQRLLPAVQDALHQVERTFGTGLAGTGLAGFDPATSRRQFVIGLSGQSILVLSGLVRLVHQAAPHAQLDLRPITAAAGGGERGLLACDLLIAPPGFLPDGQQKPEVIYRDRFVYVADPGNPRLRDGRLSLADLAALPHAVARRLPVGPDAGAGAGADTGTGTRADADGVMSTLASHGVRPTVVLTTTGWLPLPFAVAGTDLVAAVPERLARIACAASGVAVVEPPFGTVELTEVGWWHPMHATDPALTWLRGLLSSSTAGLEASVS
jgi:DNA-binding transcriptional LysR family regulator